MKAYLRGFYYSLPIQLLFLHFRKYQVLLVFWFVLFSTVNGTFMNGFGADSLYLAPEYLGDVNAFSSAIVGISVGMFVMSWNITTFILFSRYFKFLATATYPLLKYCINNSIIPLVFLVFYFFKVYRFDHFKELISTSQILFLATGFLAGLVFILTASFVYFFSAHRTIMRRMQPIMDNPKDYIAHLKPGNVIVKEEEPMHVEWYMDSFFSVRKTRDVSHYTREFLDSIFKRHHFAAVLSVFIAFLFLIVVGNFLEHRFFQIPAAASITIFFAILIGVSGAFAYFLQSWSIPYLIVLILTLNVFYKLDWIDPRNKAYGLNYQNRSERPEYSRDSILALCTPDKIARDEANMIRILENWKKRQPEEKPLLLLVNTSGGGSRSATFTMNMLQRLDSVTGGEFFRRTFLITGSSGGMIGASYFRELYRLKEKGQPINLHDPKYVNDIAGDLLNPVFSSFVARDLISPAQKFKVGPYTYVKDRGYAFESKLNENTRGILNKKLGDYKDDEYAANIPLIFYNAVITQDGRKLLMSTQPVSFMMQPIQDTARIPYMDPDALDFAAFFRRQDPYNMRLLTTMRMNATFPVVLPNVWLPSSPVIDVMDAGLRDNFGQESSLRFLRCFDDWIRENTRGVLLVQLKDRASGGWDAPYVSDDISDHATKPFLLLQHNWYKMMEYNQNEVLSYYAENSTYPVHKLVFQYIPQDAQKRAVLNFHLSEREKRDIAQSLNSPANGIAFRELLNFLHPPVTGDE